MNPAIRNIVFDIGNVIVRWNTTLIVTRTFGAGAATPDRLAEIFRGDTWRALNLGQLSEAEAGARYRAALGWSAEDTERFFFHVKDTQDPVEGTHDLIARLRGRFRLFLLSDNVHEIVAHLRARYGFWRDFEGAVLSAELGCMKPSPAIYRHLIERFAIDPAETVFLDDLPANVEGAREAGLHAVCFADAAQATRDLAAMGVEV